jgi:fimbrial chaperone protein
MRFSLARIIAAALFIFAPSFAYGSVIEVRPTMLVITPSQRVAVLSLVNPDASDVVYQVRIFRWRQNEGKQILEPTDDVIASPPIASLAGHGSQVVRVGLRGASAPDQETAYRLILEELPATNKPGLAGLNISLRLSLPLFVRSQFVLPPDQLAANMRVSGNKATVTVHNNGPFTSRIIQATLAIPAAGDDKPSIKSLTYILPGQWASYDFALASPLPSSRGAVLTVQTDSGPVDLDTPVVAEAATDAPPPMGP